MPRLPGFIRDNTEQILAEWETFARSLPQGAAMDVEALRDDAREMLDGIARELETPRTPQKQAEAAEGRPNGDGHGSTAAQGHGAGRAESGFTIAQTVAEFRALRVGVVTLWISQNRELDTIDLLDLSRFNEAIDQAIAESITVYSDDLDRAKDRFIAILGHDLRSPLNAITMSASFLLEEGRLHEPFRGMVSRIAGSAKTMNRLVVDLLGFARIRFGAGIPIEIGAMDVSAVIQGVVAEVIASHPESDVKVEMVGNLRGEWDASRLAQALTNLITNAVEHGVRTSAVRVTARGANDEITVSVHNHGQVIPEEQRGRLFDGTVPRRDEEAESTHHLGLGLYIVHRIITAHGGSIEVESSSEAGTTFTVHLPRRSAPRAERSRAPRRRVA